MTFAVVGFIDMDCFYVAVERRWDPSLVGVPCAVVQYNSRQAGGAPELPAEADRRVQGGSSGGIIAVSYEARKLGVTRQMSAQEARKQCPEVVLIQVPTSCGKADLRIYKSAGDEVVALLAKRATACEKRSVDEVAIDITAEAERLLRECDWEKDLLPKAREASHLADSALSRKAATVTRDDTRRGHAGQLEQPEVEPGGAEPEGGQEGNQGWDWSFFWGQQERLMVAGAVVVAELRAAIFETLGFSCSGGIAQNKLLAKLGCGLHKPNQQTIVLPEAVPHLLRDLPLERLQGLGGELGAQVRQAFGIATASELASLPLERLEAAFPKQAAYLHALAEGRHDEPVQNRELCLSLSGSKTFFGALQLNSVRDCEHWLGELARELHRRYMDDLHRHGRAPTRISVHINVANSSGTNSRQMPLDLGRCGTVAQIVNAAKMCFRRWLPSGSQSGRALGIVVLGMALSGMQDVKADAPISRFFGAPMASAGAEPSHGGTAVAAPHEGAGAYGVQDVLDVEEVASAGDQGVAAVPVCGGDVPVGAVRKQSVDAHGPQIAPADLVVKKGPLLCLLQGKASAAGCPSALEDTSRSTTPNSCADVGPIDLEAEPEVNGLDRSPRPASMVAEPEGQGMAEQVDPEVLAQLPPAVQAEVLMALPPDARRSLELHLQQCRAPQRPQPQPPLPAAKRQRGLGIAAYLRPRAPVCGAAGA